MCGITWVRWYAFVEVESFAANAKDPSWVPSEDDDVLWGQRQCVVASDAGIDDDDDDDGTADVRCGD
jgi:hypothetical protein